MKYLLGVDFGGGASKAALLGTDGHIAAQHTMEYPTRYAPGGVCEQRPEDWVHALCENVRGVLGKSRAAPRDILAVALDSATHTWLACGEDFAPLRPAIHWTDCRARGEAEALRAEHGDEIFRLCCHVPDTIWSLPQICWMRANEPSLFARVRHIFFEKDYLRWWLTGVYGTDRIEAQGSMLFDSFQGRWSPELLALAGLNAAALPPVGEPDGIVGGVTDAAAARTGLCAGTPVVCGTTDTALELLAAGAIHPGDTTVKLATAGRVCVVTERPFPNRRLVNYSHVVPGLWYPGTATKAAAASLRWYRDTFGGAYAALDAAAAQVPAGCDGLRFHPYLNGELTPYGDPLLCGSFTGVRAAHTKAHFTRAVLEGVALSLLHGRQTLRELGVACAPRAVLLGGGAKSALWRQITADCLGTALVCTENSDSSLGAAMLAGVAAGVFADWEDAARRCVRVRGVTEPDAARCDRYAAIFREYVALHDALAPVYRRRAEQEV